MKNDLYLGDTILTHDDDWAGTDGTHAVRTAVYVGDAGDGRALVMRTSTAGPRQGKAPRRGCRRIVPSRKRGVGNSLERACDLIGDERGVVALPWGCIIRRLGSLSAAEVDWMEDRLDALGL